MLREIRVKADPVLPVIEQALRDWLEECTVQRRELLRMLPDLGDGEREVITQAMERETVSVVLDDVDARRMARRMGMTPIGTVGILLAARKRRTLPSLRHEIERLHIMGFWISEELETAVLREAGEE